MIYYRLYKLDRRGHIVGPPEVVQCEDDDSVLIEARKYLDGHAIEVWRGDSRVGLIPPDR